MIRVDKNLNQLVKKITLKISYKSTSILLLFYYVHNVKLFFPFLSFFPRNLSFLKYTVDYIDELPFPSFFVLFFYYVYTRM